MSSRKSFLHVLFIVVLLFNFALGRPAQAAPSAQSAFGCPCSFSPDPTGIGFEYSNPVPIETGLKFRSDVLGQVTGVRFYKASGSTGTHIGRLRLAASGAILAEVNFTNETPSGWQTAYFTAPVTIEPNTTYIISNYMQDGNHRFSDTYNYLATVGMTNGPLHALVNGVDGPNGVYGENGGALTSSYQSSYYWVDLIFDDTPDTVAPTITAVSPADGATGVLSGVNVAATFDEGINAATLTGNFELRDGTGTLVSAAVSYTTATRVAVLDPAAGLALGATYTATVKGGAAGVKDFSGNALAADRVWSFTIESSDTTIPVVTATTPTAGAVEVTASADVSAVFSEAMDPATLTAATFVLRDPYNTPVLAAVSYNAATSTAVLNPDASLNLGATYTAVLAGGANGVKDAAGNPLAADVTWSFTVALPPAVSAVSPTNASIDVLIGSNATVTFNKAMDPATVTPVTFQLRDSGGSPVGAVVTYNAANKSATLNPDANLAYSTVYTATVKAGADGVKDPLGNVLAADYTWSFTTESMDITPPTVTAVKPINGVTRLRLATSATAYFSRNMNPATITAATFELRDPANNLIDAAVTYNAAEKSAILNPTADLAYSTVYTVRVKGGPDGVKDENNIALAADYTWTFSTVASRPPVDQAPGGPILIIASPTSLYTRYYTEILRTEGLNAFALLELPAVTAEVLSGYDVVILGEMALTPAQVTMLTSWVTGGGNLIAMRPDKQLADLLGLADAGATLANGYLLFDTARGPGKGIVSQTLQFHGTADRYTAPGADVLATLYATLSTPTPNPAVTLRSVGTNGGQAAAFTFDLARSIIYTHQGNPAWQINHVNPYQGYGTAVDLFAGINGEANWIDFNRITIPQADEQQRFLANLILSMNADKKPLPRFWYLPGGEKAAIILTGDDHQGRGSPSGSSQVFFDLHISQSPAGCSVADWECIRSSSYGYTGALLTDAQAAAYTALGFEFGLHADAGLASGGGWCGTWPSDMPAKYADQFEELYNKYASLPVQGSERNHCYSWFGYTGAPGWNGYTSTPQVQASQGIRLDTNISYNPAGWASVNPGYQMGSGMMMRFAEVDLNGEMKTFLDIYNAGTQMNDDNGQGAAAMRSIVDAFLDNATGPNGYYGGFVVNMHSDNWYGWSYEGSNQIVASAKAHGVPVVSGTQMVEWLDGRNSSSFSNITWDGTHLSFSVTAAPGARNLQAMLPVRSGVIPIDTLTRDGNPVSLRLETIKGVEYAFFAASTGAYTATYTPDTTPPAVTGVSASPAVGGTAAITWTTGEPATSRVEYGTSPTALTLSGENLDLVTAHSLTLTNLLPNTVYHYRVVSTDGSGNTTTWPATGTLTFTTPSAAFIDTTVADFGAGTPDAGVVVIQLANGEVILKPALATDFSGTSLPAGWANLITGGNVTVSGGQVTVDANNVGTTATFGPGRSLEGVATFTAERFQHLGFAINLSGSAGDQWAIISTGPTGAGLMARTWNGTGNWDSETRTAIPGDFFGQPHRFRIDWGTSSIDYYVDGVKVATHNLTLAAPMRPAVSDSVAGANNISADWLTLSPYAATGTFTSRLFDAQGEVTSGQLAIEQTVPTGAGLALLLRSGNTPLPDATWTAFTPVASGDALPTGFRYFQYRADFTGSGLVTPTLHEVRILYNRTDDTVPPVLTGRFPAVNAVNVSPAAEISVSFNELINSATLTAATFRVRAEGSSTDVPAAVRLEGVVATLEPTAALTPNSRYNVTLSGSVADTSGNTLGADVTWSFQTAELTEFVDDTAADFTSGVPGAGVSITPAGNGGLILTPALNTDFSGAALPDGWEAVNFTTGGTAVIADGVLTLDGARANPVAMTGPGRSVEGRVTFANAPFQHFGFGVAYMVDGTPWAIFSTGSAGNGVYARTYNGTPPYDTAITLIPGIVLGTPHTYRIDWLADHFDYYVDGVLVATHTVAISASMRPAPADSTVGGASLTVDWMRASPYAASGSLTSRVFDAGIALQWQELTWQGSAPAGTGTAASFETRTGTTPEPDASWSPWQAVTDNAIASPSARYIQYRVALSSTDPLRTPIIEQVALRGVKNLVQTRQVTLQPGWNLISLALKPASTAPADVFAGIAGSYSLVYAWDGPSQSWRHFDPTPESPDNLSQIDEGMGVWVNVTAAAPVTLEVTGQLPTTTTIGLEAGWNLVGYPAGQPGPIPASFAQVYAYHAADSQDPWKSHNAGAPAWANDLKEFAPQWGYWVQVQSQATWTVP